MAAGLLQSAVWAEVQSQFHWYPVELDGIPGEELAQGLARQLGPLTWMLYVPHAPGRGTGRDLLDSLLRLADAAFRLLDQLASRGRWTSVVRFDLDWTLPPEQGNTGIRSGLRRTLNPLLSPGSTLVPQSIQPDRYLRLDLHRGRDAVLRRLGEQALSAMKPLRQMPPPVRNSGPAAVAEFFRALPRHSDPGTVPLREEREWWALFSETLPRFGGVCSTYLDPEHGTRLLVVEFGDAVHVVDAMVPADVDLQALVRVILGAALDRIQDGGKTMDFMRLRPYLGGRPRWRPGHDLARELGLLEVQVLGTYDCILHPGRYRLWTIAERRMNRRIA